MGRSPMASRARGTRAGPFKPSGVCGPGPSFAGSGGRVLARVPACPVTHLGDTLHHMDAPTPPLPRPHRIVVNVDAETLRLLDAIAAMSRESRSAVVADILQTFCPMFEPVAKAVDRVRSKPAEAVRLMREHADTLHTLTAELVERARTELPIPGDAPAPVGGAATTAGGRARGRRSPQPPSQ